MRQLYANPRQAEMLPKSVDSALKLEVELDARRQYCCGMPSGDVFCIRNAVGTALPEANQRKLPSTTERSDRFRDLVCALIGMDQADDVVCATTHMLAACLRPSQRTLAEARSQVEAVTLERIQRHIASQLGAPLTPDALCRAFGISHHRLYQLFAPLGGVARYVQQRRLHRAFQCLANPAYLRLRVAEVAARLGFASEAHFSRAFRTAFGHTPSDVRAMA